MTSQKSALHSAILDVQKAAPKLQRDAINPHFGSSYISLQALMEAVLPLLAEAGLTWVTIPGYRDIQDGGLRAAPTLEYVLTHADSGESLKGTMLLMCAKQDPQGQGSAITYARRYSLMAVLGLVADEDDDGNAASAPPARRRQSQRKPDAISKETVREISSAIRERKVPEAEVRLMLATVGIEDADSGTVSQKVKSLSAKQGEQLIHLLAAKA